MIPKIIHYCWFGRNPLPELAIKCIESWKKFLPDYEIKEWNEDNYDVHKILYISQAYDAKKYAFVSDYARFDILYQYGGIYFDTDVEVIKDLTPIIKQGAFLGMENVGLIATGLGIGSPASTEIFKEIMDSYKEDSFLLPDYSMNLKTVVIRVSDIFKKYGFTDDDAIQNIKGFRIYPAEYFCPKNPQDKTLRITENSYTIHHFDGSWISLEEKKRTNFRKKVEKAIGKNPLSKIIRAIYNMFSYLREGGVQGLIKHYKALLSH